jgi:CubicO group peptidase (beta-lactamase class C family)
MRVFAILAIAICLCCTGIARGLESGLWQARHLNNTVSVQGTLIVGRDRAGWYAAIGAETARGSVSNGRLSFVLPQCKCKLEAAYTPGSQVTIGHWYQAPTADSGNAYASPVTLRRVTPTTYSGLVRPLYDPFNFYLSVGAAHSPMQDAFLVNPERDLGDQWNVSGVRVDATALQLVGGKTKRDVVAQGVLRPDGTASLYFEGRGGTYDFTHVTANAATDFYPRGRAHVAYSYAPPPQLHDGWRVASVEDVGISKSAIEKFVQFLIDMPMDGPKARQIHSVLIARHGKLVLEEYFHGMTRDRPHDPRSASKSITSALFGAAMQAGIPVSPSTPVYKVMNGGAFPIGIDPLKRQMTVEALLTMSSGWDCDDNDDSSPGSEDNISDNLHVADWYAYTLSLKMLRAPRTEAVYCSIQPNMVGGVLTHATHRSIPELFQRLIAGPMQIDRYYIPIQGNGDAYMGGGLRLLARDFMKFPQMYMDGGVWNGKRIIGKGYVTRATSPLVRLRYTKDIMYGYLWWIQDFQYAGHTYRAFSMLGAGGQTFTAIPALDMVVGFEAGDYMHRLPHVFSTYIPHYILPAVTQ